MHSYAVQGRLLTNPLLAKPQTSGFAYKSEAFVSTASLAKPPVLRTKALLL